MTSVEVHPRGRVGARRDARDVSGQLTERRSVQERRSGHDRRRMGHAQELGLTPRQLEIVANVVAGFSNKEIAQKLSLSEDTVKHHLTNIFDRIGVSKRLELALFATHHRLNAEPPGV